MLDIAISYDDSTKLLSVSDEIRCDETIGGTIGDANTTRLNFTITGIEGQYAVKCALGSPIKNGHDVTFPEYPLTNNSLIIPGEVMSSALHGEIPVQLHFTTATEEWYSENCVKLKILPAIRGKDLEIIPPVPRPESDIVTDVTYDGDVTLTIHYAEAQQKQIVLNNTVPEDVAHTVRIGYVMTDGVHTEYAYEFNLGYMPSSVSVLERNDSTDGSVGSHRTTYYEDRKYDVVETGMEYTMDKVTLRFAVPPGGINGKVFWIKVVA